MILDLFAGPGGWSEGLRLLGLPGEVGVELDPWACATRRAAGHATVRADVARMPVRHLLRKIIGLIASPPCQGLSAAGLREGVADLDLVIELLGLLWGGHDRREQYAARMADVRSILLAEPLRFALAARPEWIALEQVPAALPVWEATAAHLRAEGYSTWTGTLNAADYGVPQTRTRAILIASRARKVARPMATHYDQRKGAQLWGEPWVSMAEALGWGASERPSLTVTAGGGKSGGPEPFPSYARAALESERDRGAWVVRTNSGNGYAHDYERSTDEPSPSITSRSDRWRVDPGAGGYAEGWSRGADAPSPTIRTQTKSWVLRSGQSVAGEGRAERELNEPAVTITGRADLCAWTAERPATTGASTDRIAKPGHRDREGGERQFEDSVRISLPEAAVLQSFPADYPWQGTKTKRFEQVGNAVPPLLAAHVIAEAAGVPVIAAAASERAA